MILFYSKPTRNPQSKEQGFSAAITAVSPVSLNRIVERIQARCTVNSADIKLFSILFHHQTTTYVL